MQPKEKGKVSFNCIYIPYLLLPVPGSWCDEEGWLLLRGREGPGVSLSLSEYDPNVTALQLGLQLPAMDDLRRGAGPVWLIVMHCPTYGR